MRAAVDPTQAAAAALRHRGTTVGSCSGAGAGGARSKRSRRSTRRRAALCLQAAEPSIGCAAAQTFLAGFFTRRSYIRHARTNCARAWPQRVQPHAAAAAPRCTARLHGGEDDEEQDPAFEPHAHDGQVEVLVHVRCVVRMHGGVVPFGKHHSRSADWACCVRGDGRARVSGLLPPASRCRGRSPRAACIALDTSGGPACWLGWDEGRPAPREPLVAAPVPAQSSSLARRGMAATSPAQAAPDMRTLVAKLQQRSFAAFAVCFAALLGAQLLRTVAPPAGSADVAAQMPWVQPYLQAMRRLARRGRPRRAAWCGARRGCMPRYARAAEPSV